MPHFYISAAHKSSGKTTVSIGLCAALARRGLSVRPFKKGPDYIDPMWLGRASGNPCHNLDYQTMSPEEMRQTFATYMKGGDIGIIEGNKGLYDGMDPEGRNSNAALAKLLQAPVILVIDTHGTTRGIAPLLLGYQAFDPAVQIGGVILNLVGGPRHESKLRAAVEHYTDLPVLGAVHKDPELEIRERHLGLIPSNEAGEVDTRIDVLADRIGSQVDLDAILDLARLAPTPSSPGQPHPPLHPSAVTDHQRPVRIAIARDAAFGFYYPGDLEALEEAGAELVAFDTLSDCCLPEVDGLFIGGGFPETQAERLEANVELRQAIREAIENGLPSYAECGGLMYLARSIQWDGKRYEMVGVVPGDAVIQSRPVGRGYTRLRETGLGPWPLPDQDGVAAEFPAHEFHYSAMKNLSGGQRFAYRVLRGHGIDGRHDGIVYKNLLASYTHLRHVQGNPWTRRFVDFVRRVTAEN
jgi:cobyrinic acid a,c-diamide synthase